MKSINIRLENCYGIKKLNAEFDFSEKNIVAVYAPNGVMKTSFAKTFKDVCNDADTIDYIQIAQLFVKLQMKQMWH